jgi:hypothetical protein
MLRKISELVVNKGSNLGFLKNVSLKQKSYQKFLYNPKSFFSNEEKSKLKNVVMMDLEKQINPNVKINTETNTISTEIDGKTVEYKRNVRFFH